MKTITNILLFVIAVIAIGCSEPCDSRINMGNEVQSDNLVSNYVTRPIGAAVSALMGEGIDIKDVKMFRNESGFLEVHIYGYNRVVGTKRFEYKVDWIDCQGLLIDSKASTWLPMSALGKSSVTFNAVATSPDAVDFRVNTRKQK